MLGHPSTPTRDEESKVTAKLTAFIVDDDPLMMELLGIMLEKRFFEAVIYHDPYKLLEDLVDSAPDVIFSDLEMPLMDGSELAAKARKSGYSGAIVLVTASRNFEKISRAFASGVDDIMLKPVREFEFNLICEKLKNRTKLAASPVSGAKWILDPLEQGAILLDGKGSVVTANRSAIEILNAESEKDTAQIIGSFCSLEKLLDSNEAASTFIEVPDTQGSGSKLIGLEFHRINDSQGQEKYYLVILNDFSRWKKMDELHTRFATYLSHGLRTPLTAAKNAVEILSRSSINETAGSEKFISLLKRNIEKLTGALDEVQKIFMLEGEQLNLSRELVSLRRELKASLEDIEGRGIVKGYKLKCSDMTVITGKRKLGEFVSIAAETISRWLEERPYIECSVTRKEGMKYQPQEKQRVKISIRTGRRKSKYGLTLKEFLSLYEAHRGLVLQRIGEALDGEVSISSKNEIKMYIPFDPDYCKEKDLVNPLKVMSDRAEVEGTSLYLVNLRMVGAGGKLDRFKPILLESMYSVLPEGSLVSRAERPWDYGIFIIGLEADEIETLMESVRERFALACSDGWEELYPTLKWHITYNRESSETKIDEILHLTS